MAISSNTPRSTRTHFNNMPYFEYDAVNPDRFSELKGLRLKPGKVERFVDDFAGIAQIHSGVIEANSPEDAVAQLNGQGLVPLRLAVAKNREGIRQILRLKKKTVVQAPPTVSLYKPRKEINWSIVGVVVFAVLVVVALYYGSKQ